MPSSSNANDPSWKVAREWAAAGVGCSLADTLFNPLEVLKVRLQTATMQYSAGQLAVKPSIDRIAREAVNSRGVIGGLLEPGLMATWLRGLSYTGEIRLLEMSCLDGMLSISFGTDVTLSPQDSALASTLLSGISSVTISWGESQLGHVPAQSEAPSLTLSTLSEFGCNLQHRHTRALSAHSPILPSKMDSPACGGATPPQCYELRCSAAPSLQRTTPPRRCC